MGNGIAHTFAQSGFTVKLIDFLKNLWIKEWLQLLPI
jgi:3-hydroxyacyl-CoA dehydrogenase